MLFLVKGEIRIRHYMHDEDIIEHALNLVEAFDKYDAMAKFEKYYTDQTVDYDVSYYVRQVDVADTII